ncbi:MAG: hypothetical protein JKY93_10005 [Gammaproteobacteria bacterium]|nr:hypothetical protein [Gammaproteobacteria bacterium]
MTRKQSEALSISQPMKPRKLIISLLYRPAERCAAVKPIIGYLKSDYRLNRNHLKGNAGGRANVVLAAAACNDGQAIGHIHEREYY